MPNESKSEGGTMTAPSDVHHPHVHNQGEPTPRPRKRPYSPPKLTSLGRVGELTFGHGGKSHDIGVVPKTG
jgi:hypothetical protein